MLESVLIVSGAAIITIAFMCFCVKIGMNNMLHDEEGNFKYIITITFLMTNHDECQYVLFCNYPHKSITSIQSDGYIKMEKGFYSFCYRKEEVMINKEQVSRIIITCKEK